MNFENKVVLVTGASSGIGAATALKFSSYGAKVAIVGRNEKKIKKVLNAIEMVGKQPLPIFADITNDEDAKRIVDETVQHFGRLDILVNNAGTVGFGSILSDNAIELFDKVMAINLRSHVCITKLAIPYLIETRGNIVNVSSIGSIGVLAENNFAYCTSKAALDHFTRSVALDLSEYKIRVNTVNPGPVKTDFLETMGLNKEEQEKAETSLAKSSSLGKMCEPEEIANLVLFLSSDMAKSITGVSYVIDNGMLLKGSFQMG